MKKRAALYHRVSTADQNPRAARLELRRAAKQRGLKVVLEIEETASGASSRREGLDQVLDHARRGLVDQVLVWKLDRFGRSLLGFLKNLEELERAGVGFAAITQGIECQPGGDVSSRFFLNILGAVAEFERGLIGERTRLGLAAARARGAQLGRPPKPWPPHFVGDVVKSRRLDGKSWRAIARDLGCKEWEARRAFKEGTI
jgi:putative DNA-invertase from lambdoid prophage Rac